MLDDHLDLFGCQGLLDLLPDIQRDHLDRVEVGCNGSEQGIGHPDVLDPKPALILRHLAGQKGEHLLYDLLIGQRAHRAEHGKQDGHLYQHGQAARQRAVTLFAHQFLLLLLQLLLVVGIFLLQFVQLRLNLRHLPHSLAVLDIKGHQDHLDKHREDDDGPSVIGYDRIDPVEHSPKRVGYSSHLN